MDDYEDGMLPPIYGNGSNYAQTGSSTAGLPESDDVVAMDEFEKDVHLITSVFVEGDWSIARLRQRIQKAATELIKAVDTKLLFVDEILRNTHISFEASLPGYVVKTGDSLVILNGELSAKNTADVYKRLETLAARGVHYLNLLALPVFYPSGKIIAVLQCNSKREGSFTMKDFILLRMLCSFAGKAAANCRLMESLTEGQKKTRVLNKAAIAISSELSMEAIFRKVGSLGCELVDADRVTLYVATEDKTSLWTRVTGTGKKGSSDKHYPLDGMLGYTMRTNESLNVKDVAKDARFKAFFHRTGGEGIVDCICVPAKNSVGETVGVIQAANMAPGRTFTKGDVERLGGLGTYAMTSLQNSKALDKAARLSIVSVSIMERLDLEDTRSKIEEKTQELVNAQLANLFILEEEMSELVGYMLVGRSKTLEKVRIPLGKYPVGQVAVSGHSMILGDNTRDLKALASLDERFGSSTRNLLTVPMRNAQGKVIAVMQASNKRAGAFTNLDESLLSIFMNSAGIAMSNALQAHELANFLRSLKDLVARTGTIGSSLDFDTCLHQVQANGLDVIPAQALTLHMLDAKTRALHTKHGGDRPDTICQPGAGIAGYVAETASLLNVPICEEDSRFHPKVDGVRGLRPESCICVPVMNATRDKVLAVLQWLNKKGGRRFTALDESLSQVFANIVSVAMLNTQAREESLTEKTDLLDQCSKQQELLEIAQSITNLPSVDSVAMAVTKHATTLLEANRCTVFMCDRDNNLLSMIGTDLRPKQFAVSGIVGEVVTTGKSQVINNVASHPSFNPAVDQRPGCHARSMVCVAIYNPAKQVIGAVQVLNKLKGNFKETDAGMLAALGSLAATSFMRVESLERVMARNHFLRTISSDLDRHAVINLMTNSAKDVFKAADCRVFMTDMANSEIWTKSWANKMDTEVFRVPINQGIVGFVAVKGGSVNIRDVRQDERYNPQVDNIGDRPTTSMMVASMPDQTGKVLAVMQVTNRLHRPHFDAEEEEFLNHFCQQAGVVLKNSLLFGHAMDSKHYHRNLVGAALRVCSESELDRSALELCARTRDLLDVDSCHIYLREPESEKMTVEGWLRWPAGSGKERAEKLKHLVGLAARVVMTGEVSVALDEPDESDGPRPSGRTRLDTPRRARNILSAPIFGLDRSVIGLIQISRLQGAKPFGHESEEHLKAVCDIAAVALTNSSQHLLLTKELQMLREKEAMHELKKARPADTHPH
eukprot:CAMPEP_0114548596 /NCGR_PEP_ID=MMETSP0114-20121206/5068_1 /TAXON_ID=31324 /ORGANISM="Goniomonas sp, Strain m" /LENGTH=1229 /DNA_ID=CAMNT_0001733201 /DNA_START=197 /DNA_END=3886 /DNA_ORIENTATION=+